MKKVIVSFLVFLLGMSICGCGVKDVGENAESENVSNNVSSEEFMSEQEEGKEETEENLLGEEKEKEPIEPIPGKKSGLYYAFQNGLLTINDLETIAYYLNNELQPAEALDPTIEASIQETEAESIRKDPHAMMPDYPAENINILGFYGVYQSKYYVYTITPWGANCCANIRCSEIGGVKFFLCESTSIRIWYAVE